MLCDSRKTFHITCALAHTCLWRCVRESKQESQKGKTEFGQWWWTEPRNTHSILWPHNPHCLSLTRAVNRMVVNWSFRSPSIFTCFFCAAFQMVTVVTCHPSVEGKWFSWWRITGFSQSIIGSCRHHQSWLSCLTDPCLLRSEITLDLQMFYC